VNDVTSQNHKLGEYVWVQYNFNGVTLTVTKMTDSYWAPASNRYINEIVIMNVYEQPTAVYNRWVNNAI
jgi:hypothetical protein